CWPLAASPECVAFQGGGVAPPKASGLLQRARIFLIRESICASVSRPPLSTLKPGISVPFSPLATMSRSEASSMSAWYSGLLRSVAAPPWPFLPWQPAQFSPYSLSNDITASGRATSGPAAGRPGRLHPLTAMVARAAEHTAMEKAFITCVPLHRAYRDPARHRVRRVDRCRALRHPCEPGAAPAGAVSGGPSS